ncbi:acyltransferase [Aquamicrobium zhengzhouense]|uniref:Acyltransferase n=1 Tax=Aquamicrobium zhengzhouense TaxID=2781738 RepID=A0ABS0S9N4_9HYPH|nr:acyltransferase [Aquamicrobium zhengzhouense]MBI1619217.1 acyltransferase [Aquamicrobium zhengzhouense]
MLKAVFHAIYKRLDGVGYARSLGVRVGDGCRLLNVSFSTEPYLVTIGNHVSATHTHFETHDGGVWVFREHHPELDLIKSIEIGNNVFIGRGCIILPGAKVGNDVVIGAGAVVTGEVPDGCVAAGVPARIIGSVRDYEAKVLAAGSPTKNMSPKQKRAFLCGSR